MYLTTIDNKYRVFKKVNQDDIGIYLDDDGEVQEVTHVNISKEALSIIPQIAKVVCNDIKKNCGQIVDSKIVESKLSITHYGTWYVERNFMKQCYKDNSYYLSIDHELSESNFYFKNKTFTTSTIISFYKGNKTNVNIADIFTNIDFGFDFNQYVSFPLRKEKMGGNIKTYKFDLKKKKLQAQVVCIDGKTRFINYDKLVASDKPKIKINRDWEDGLPDTVIDNIDFALKNVKASRLKIHNGKVKIVSRYYDGSKTENIIDGQYIKCPNCDTKICIDKHRLDYHPDEHIVQCYECEQVVVLLDVPNSLFYIPGQPSKNTYCFEESRCCNNCGFFNFPSGQHGKRATGYCKIHNYCVLAHNTCVSWFPNSAKRFGTQMSKQTTNLSKSVKMFKDKPKHLIYTKEDHTQNLKYSKKYCAQYRKAYAWILNKLNNSVK